MVQTKGSRRAGAALAALALALCLGAVAAPVSATPRRRAAAVVPARRPVSVLHQVMPIPLQGLRFLVERRGDLLEAIGMRDMHCAACLEQLESERDYPPGLEAHLDWNRMTTWTLGDTVLRLTNVQPFSFLLRKHF